MRKAYVIYRRVKYRYEYINMTISAVPFIDSVPLEAE